MKSQFRKVITDWLRHRKVYAFANEVLANAQLAGQAFALRDGGNLFVPFGEFGHSRGRQNFDSESALLLIANFNKPWQRLKRYIGMGIPVYVGHPDVPGMEAKYPDKKAYGWVDGLQIESDGMRIIVKWSEDGTKLISNAHYRYHSPFWDSDPDGKGGHRPNYLISVGLTNTPNIPVPAIANDAEQPTDQMKINPELLKLLGLGETADEAALIQAITALNEKCKGLQNDLNAAKEKEVKKPGEESEKVILENSVRLANVAASAARSARVQGALDILVREGKVLPADREAESTRLIGMANEADVTAELEKINKLAPKLKTRSVTQDAASRRTEALTPIVDKAKSVAIANAIESELAALDRRFPNSNNYNLAWQNVRSKQPALFQNA